MAAWFSGKLDLNSIKDSVANTLKDVLDEDGPEGEPLRALEAEISALKASNEALKKEKELEARQLKEILIEKEEEIRGLQGWGSPDEPTEEKESSSTLVSRIKELESRLKEVSGGKSLKGGSSNQSENIKELNAKLQEQASSFEKERIHSLQNLSESQEQVSSLQNQIKDLQAHLSSLQAQKNDVLSHESINKELNINLLQEQASSFEKERSLSSEELRDSQKQVSDLQNQIEDLQNTLSSYKDNQAKSTHDDAVQKELSLKLSEQASAFEKERQISSRSLCESQKRVSNLSNEIESLQSSLSVLQDTHTQSASKFMDEFTGKEKEFNSKLIEQASVFDKERSIACDALNHSRKQVSSLQNEIEELKSSGAKAGDPAKGNNNTNSKGLKNKLKASEKALRASMDDLKAQRKDFELERSQFQESLSNQIAQGEESQALILKDRNEVIEGLREELNSLKRSNQKAETDDAALKEALQSKEEVNERILMELEELQRSREDSTAKESMTSRIAELENEVANLREENAALQRPDDVVMEDESLDIQINNNNAVPLTSMKEQIKQTSDMESDLMKLSSWKKSTFSLLGVESNEECESLLKDMKKALRGERGDPLSTTESESLQTILESFKESREEESLRKELSEALELANEEKKYLEKTLMEKERMMLGNEKSISEYKEALEDVKRELSTLTDSGASESSKLTQEILALEGDLQALKEQKIRLTEENITLKTISSEAEKLKVSLEESLKTQNEAFCSKNSDLEEQLRTLSLELEEIKAAKATELEQRNTEATRTIETLSSTIKTLENEGSQSMKDKINGMVKERADILGTLESKHAESLRYHEEVQRLNVVVEDLKAECEGLKSLKEKEEAGMGDEVSKDQSTAIASLKDELHLTIQELSKAREEREILKENENSLRLSVKDKEYDLLMARKNMENMEGLLRDKEASWESLQKDMDQLKGSLKDLQAQSSQLKQGKEDAETVSSGKDRELLELRREVNNLIDKKRRLEQESERLKEHLVSVEEGYTQDAIECGSREQDLRIKLQSTEEALRISSAQHSTAVQEATQLGGSLGSQVSQLREERDEAQRKFKKLSKDYKDQSRAVENLQLALDGFRREQENEIHFSQQFLQDKLKYEQDKIVSKESEIQSLRSQLETSKEELSNKESLMETLEHKSHIISTLKQEIHSREELLKTARSELSTVHSNQSAKVDKTLIKNLVVGYAGADERKKGEILKIIGTVLDFTPEERKKSGLEGGSWSWFRSSDPQGSSVDQSLASAFVKFLETESNSVNGTGTTPLLPNPPSSSSNTPTSFSSPPNPTPSQPLPGHRRNASWGSNASSSDRSSPNPLLNNPSGNNVSLPLFSINRSSSSILKTVLIEEKEKQ